MSKEPEEDNNSTLEVSIKIFLGNGYIHLSEVTGTVLKNSQNLNIFSHRKVY
jgi:hypothetical protein